jgi:hypothetical protein
MVGTGRLAGLRLPVAIVLLATAVAFSSVAVVALSQGGSFQAETPEASAPPWSPLNTVPSAYDTAMGADLFLFTNGETWTYAGGVWTDISSTAGTPTGMGFNVVLAYDPALAEVVAFGGATGYDDIYHLADTWLFQAGHWENETPSLSLSPPVGEVGFFAYDPSDQALLLFGGEVPGSGAYPVLNPDNQTWTFDGAGWTNVTGPGPPSYLYFGGGLASEFAGMTTDPSTGGVLYYPYDSGCQVATVGGVWSFVHLHWTKLTGAGATLPCLVFITSFTDDSSAGYILVQGYCQHATTFPCPVGPDGNVGVVQTFEVSSGQWTLVPVDQGPHAGFAQSSVDDPSDGGVLVVGGCCWGEYSGLSLPLDGVWIYTSGDWTEHFPWGGGPAPWGDNDGAWVGLALIAVPAAGIVFPPRRPPPPPPYPWPPAYPGSG